MPEPFNLSDFAYAHRGLWSAEHAPENSLEAFLLAAEHGLGIEFDVRPSADGNPIIFHDMTLDRMTGKTGLVETRTAQELIRMPLNSGGTLISLEQLLEVWPTSLPLLCELKIDGSTDAQEFAKTVSRLLSEASGPIAAMSFSEEAVSALSDTLTRGQLIAPSGMMEAEAFAASIARYEASHADYLACHFTDASHALVQSARTSRPAVIWTVTEAELCQNLSHLVDSQIFEGFDPALAKQLILAT